MKAPRREPSPSGAWHRLSLAFAVAGSFLLFSTRQSEGFGLVKLLAMAVGAFGAWFALAVGRGCPPQERRRTPLDLPLLAFGAAFLASLGGSTDPFVGVVGMYSTYSYGLLAAILCVALFLATAWSTEPEKPEFLLQTALVAGALAGFYAVLQKAGFEPFLPTRELFDGRAGSTLGVPVPLGACLLMPMPIAAAFTRSQSPGRRALGWLCGAALAAGLACTLSRGAMLGAVVGLAVYAAASGRARLEASTGRRRWALAGAALLVAAAVIFGVGRVRKVGKADRARWELWRSTWSIVKAQPWLGTGPDTVQTALRRYRTEGFVRELSSRGSQLSAHNDFLQVWSTLGTIGLAAYLWLLWAAYAMARGAVEGPRREAAAAVAGALAGLFAQAKFNPVPLPALAMAAVFLGLLAQGPAAAGPWARGAKAGAAALCAAVLAAGLRLGAADRVFLRARQLSTAGLVEPGLNAYREAIRLNPFEVYYRMVLAQQLNAAAQRAGSGAARLRLFEEAVEQGRRSTSLRPAVADGYLITGTFLMLAKLEGGPDRLDEADGAFEQAWRLDPLLVPLLENRHKLAMLRGDPTQASRWKAEWERVKSIGIR